MLLLECTMSLQFRPSSSISNCGHFWSSEELGTANFSMPWNKVPRQCKKIDSAFMRRKDETRRIILAHRECLGSGSDHVGENEKSSYHPFEDILNSKETSVEERRLTAAETSRTMVEVNSKATMMFSGMGDDGVHHNLFWPDLPYLTDEHGNIYFQVNIKDDIMQSLTSEDNYVHVILGVDTKEILLSEANSLGQSMIDFGIEEIDEDDSDFEEEEDGSDGNEDIVDFGGEWVHILEDEDDEDQVDSDSSLGDWAKLETMRSAHPMYFASKIAEAKAASDNPIDYMRQPQDGLAIEGLIRPAFIEEQSVIQMHRPNPDTEESEATHVHKDDDPIEDKVLDLDKVNGHAIESFSSRDSGWADDVEKDKCLDNGKKFYKLEMTKIELMLASGHQAVVEVEEYRNARPDAIAHSASKIISRVNAAGEKTTHALKSLCWRSKGIHVEEASLIGVDSLGFDLRVCSGTQIQTLRFAFNSRATSEYSAERQLNDLLFPLSNQKLQKVKQAQ